MIAIAFGICLGMAVYGVMKQQAERNKRIIAYLAEEAAREAEEAEALAKLAEETFRTRTYWRACEVKSVAGDIAARKLAAERAEIWRDIDELFASLARGRDE